MSRSFALLAPVAALAVARCALFPDLTDLSGSDASVVTDTGPPMDAPAPTDGATDASDAGDAGAQPSPVVHGTSTVPWTSKGGAQVAWSVTPPVGAQKGDLLVVFAAHINGQLASGSGLTPPLTALISSGICQFNGAYTEPLDLAYVQYDGVKTSYGLTSVPVNANPVEFGAVVYAIGGRAPLDALNIDDKRAKNWVPDAGNGAAPAVTVKHDAGVVLSVFAVLDGMRDALSTFGAPALLPGPSESISHMVVYSGSFAKGPTSTFLSDAGPPTCWGTATVAIGE